MNAYGFLRKVFEVFETYKCPVDMITTSEIAVSVTIEQNPYFENIIQDLTKLGEVKIQRDQCIICLVGNLNSDSKGMIAQISHSLNGTPLRMLSYGASNNNICLLIDQQHKIEALNHINQSLFSRKQYV